MAPRGIRDQRIRDLLREHTLLSVSESSLRKYLGPEIGGLNVKQSEAIIAVIAILTQTMQALKAINDEMNEIFLDDRIRFNLGEASISIDKNGEIVLVTGASSIRMKKDGTIDIKGKDIRINGSGEINVRAAKDLTLKGSKIQQN